jgi:hypothetical protein
VPGGVPVFTGGGEEVLQPPIDAIVMASSNTGVANASLAAQTRASVCLQRRSNSNPSNIDRTQRFGKRFQGVLSREEGAGGVSNAFAVVVTLIATVAGAACVTVTGEAGPLHTALGGAPMQLTVTMS